MTLLAERPPAAERVRHEPLAVPAPGRPAGRRRLPGVFLLALVVTAVHAIGAAGWPGFGDDEGTYVAQAWAARTEGGLSHYTYWYDHPPLGWLQLSVGQWLLGPFVPGGAVEQARLLVVPYAVASALLTGLVARRLGLGRPATVLAVLLMTLSPLALAHTRGVYLHLLGLPWLLLAFGLALSPRRSLWAHAGAGLAFAVAVLSKETLLLALPGLLLAARSGTTRRTRAFCTAALLSVAGLTAFAYPLAAVLKGELLPGEDRVSLWDAVVFQLVGREGTGTALDTTSRSAGLVAGWLDVDPWLLGTGVLLAPLALATRALRVPAVTLLVLVVAGLRPGYLPQPYVLVLLPFCALVVAGLAHALAQGVGPAGRHRLRAALVAGTVAAVVTLLVVPAWASGLRTATTSDLNARHRVSLDAVRAEVPRSDRVLVDDTYYVDLVEAGFEPRYGAVWFYKMDLAAGLDPSVVRRLPRGWLDVDWVVSTPVLRSALDQDPSALEQVRLALANSRVVQTFGTGDQRVELRKVEPPGG